LPKLKMSSAHGLAAIKPSAPTIAFVTHIEGWTSPATAAALPSPAVSPHRMDRRASSIWAPSDRGRNDPGFATWQSRVGTGLAIDIRRVPYKLIDLIESQARTLLLQPRIRRHGGHDPAPRA
jgi:hypothetical protein